MKFPFSGHKYADEHTIFLTLHYLRATPKAVQVKDLELTEAPNSALVAKQYHIPNSCVTNIVCDLAPLPSRALHSHSMFVLTALAAHSTGVRNTANKETVT